MHYKNAFVGGAGFALRLLTAVRPAVVVLFIIAVKIVCVTSKKLIN